MKAHKHNHSGISGLRAVALVFSIIFTLFLPALAFADTETIDPSGAVASRVENGELLYYTTLHEAFNAAGGISLDNPDEITLLADITLDEPISIESEKHIRLIAGNGARIITRRAVIDYPLFWIRADNSSLTLGEEDAPAAEISLAIDGGYLSKPSVEARAPLIAVNGQRARLVMYDGVTLQNNYNYGAGGGTSLYENGGCVFIRTRDDTANLAAFIMKGGVIQGNTVDTQNTFPYGGGVFITGLGLFVMEGGEIRGNTAYYCGGGFAAGSRGSFQKTGGIIYGKDAPEGLRNTALNGIDEPINRLRVYAHALNINLPEDPAIQFRDDTVGEDEMLSYEGKPNGRNGIFGEGEKWERPRVPIPRYLLIVIFAFTILALAGGLVFVIKRTRRKRAALNLLDPAREEIVRNLPPREKEVFELLLTDRSLKEIAGDLHISYSGANFHTQRIYRKLDIQSRTELFALFHQNQTANKD